MNLIKLTAKADGTPFWINPLAVRVVNSIRATEDSREVIGALVALEGGEVTVEELPSQIVARLPNKEAFFRVPMDLESQAVGVEIYVNRNSIEGINACADDNDKSHMYLRSGTRWHVPVSIDALHAQLGTVVLNELH